MNKNKNETSIVIKAAYQRYISIDQNIHATLSLYALSLYMTLRYEADYTQETSNVKRSAQFLYTKAKISRAQYYRAMTELESVGLVLRDEENKLGDKCVIHVARTLNYFNQGVSDRDRGVSDRDTYQDSLSLSNINITNSESCASPAVAEKKQPKGNALFRELIDVYRKEFPKNPQPHPKVMSTSLQKTLQTLVKKWPELDPNGNPLTAEAFQKYLSLLRTCAPRFSLGEYETPSGNRKKNNLETFARWNTVVKFLENAYS